MPGVPLTDETPKTPSSKLWTMIATALTLILAALFASFGLPLIAEIGVTPAAVVDTDVKPDTDTKIVDTDTKKAADTDAKAADTDVKPGAPTAPTTVAP